MADATSFPQNLDSLHQHEEAIRGQTKEAIAASDTLRRHFSVVEASMTLLRHFSRDYPFNGEDELTVHLLGIRLFNSAAGAIQSLTSGYCQNCVMLQRDILEVAFLLDYFRTNEASIAEWRGCTENERNRNLARSRCGPNSINATASPRKTKGSLSALCNLGAHASYSGFRLLTPTAGGDAHCGPYFANGMLEVTVAELAKLCVGAAMTFVEFFEGKSVADYETNSRLWKRRSLGLNTSLDPSTRATSKDGARS